MARSLEESEKMDRIKKIHANTFYLVKKIVKIGPVDTEIALLIVKKKKNEEINASKIYSPVGNLAERAKQTKIFSGFLDSSSCLVSIPVNVYFGANGPNQA